MKQEINITVAALIYRSPRWLSFVLDSLKSAKNTTQFKTLIVANDPTEEISNDPRVNYVHLNDDPNEYYLKRVYKAWNRAVEIADTKYVVLVNSDMAFADYWLDELMRWIDDKTIPCSLLVENGWIPSAFPEYVRDFGRSPSTFNHEGFAQYANQTRRIGQKDEGRLFMPCVFNREDFLALGGYPDGNQIIDNEIISGDRFLFNRMISNGYNWITALGSIVAHCQEGEMRDE